MRHDAGGPPRFGRKCGQGWRLFELLGLFKCGGVLLGSSVVMSAAQRNADLKSKEAKDEATNKHHDAVCTTWFRYVIVCGSMWGVSLLVLLCSSIELFGLTSLPYNMYDWLRCGAVWAVAFLSHRSVNYNVMATVREHAWDKHRNCLIGTAVLMILSALYLLLYECFVSDEDIWTQLSYLKDDKLDRLCGSTISALFYVFLCWILQDDLTFAPLCLVVFMLEFMAVQQLRSAGVVFIAHVIFVVQASDLQKCTVELKKHCLEVQDNFEEATTQLLHDTSNERKKTKHIMTMDFFVFIFTQTIEYVFGVLYLNFVEEHMACLCLLAIPVFIEQGSMALLNDVDALYDRMKHVNVLTRFILLCALTQIAIYAIEMAAQGGYDWIQEVGNFDDDQSSDFDLQKAKSKARDKFWDPMHKFMERYGEKIQELVVLASVCSALVGCVVHVVRMCFESNLPGGQFKNSAIRWLTLIQVRVTLSLKSSESHILETIMCFMMIYHIPDVYLSFATVWTFGVTIIFWIRIRQFQQDDLLVLDNATANPVKVKDAEAQEATQQTIENRGVAFLTWFFIAVVQLVSINAAPIGFAWFFTWRYTDAGEMSTLAMIALPMMMIVGLFEMFGAVRVIYTHGVMANKINNHSFVCKMPTEVVEAFARSCEAAPAAAGTKQRRSGGARHSSPGREGPAEMTEFSTLVSKLKTKTAMYHEYLSGTCCAFDTVQFPAAGDNLKFPRVRQFNGLKETPQWKELNRYTACQQLLIMIISAVKHGYLSGKTQSAAITHRASIGKDLRGDSDLETALEAMPLGLFPDEERSEMQSDIESIFEWIQTASFLSYWQSLGTNPPQEAYAREVHAMCIISDNIGLPILLHKDIMAKLLTIKARLESENAAA